LTPLPFKSDKLPATGLGWLLYASILAGSVLTDVVAQKVTASPQLPKQMAVYLTAGEAEYQRPAIAFSFGESRHQIRQLWYTETKVKVITPDSVWLATQDNCWGYSDGRQTYRFADHCRYQVLDHYDSLWIYGQWRGESLSYFFSRSAGGPVCFLKKQNLKKAFSDKPRFVQLLKHIYFLRKATQDRHGAMRIITLYKLSQ
jgi:hypothetical protein